MKESNQPSESIVERRNEQKKLQFLLKVFEKLEELTSERGKEDPKIQALWSSFLAKSDSLLGDSTSASLQSIKTDTKLIRDEIGASVDPSIDYSFIQSSLLRVRLTRDNIRMNAARSNLKNSEADRFKEYCYNAHLQAEGMINARLERKSEDDLNAFKAFLEKQKSEYNWDIESDLKNIAEDSIFRISYVKKMWFAIDQINGLPGIESSFLPLDFLREIRNLWSHRSAKSSYKFKNQERKQKIEEFISQENYSLVDKTLVILAKWCKSA